MWWLVRTAGNTHLGLFLESCKSLGLCQPLIQPGSACPQGEQGGSHRPQNILGTGPGYVGAGGRIRPSPDFPRRDENHSHLRWHLALRWPQARTQHPGLAEPELRSSWWVWVCVLGVSFTPQDPPATHGCLEAGEPRSWGSSRHRLPAADAAGDTGTGAWSLNGDQLWSLAALSSSFPSPPAVWCHPKHLRLSRRSTPGCSCHAQSTPAHAGKHP